MELDKSWYCVILFNTLRNYKYIGMHVMYTPSHSAVLHEIQWVLSQTLHQILIHQHVVCLAGGLRIATPHRSLLEK